MVPVELPLVFAHGVGTRGDLPLPFWQFAWGAAVAVMVSFLALGVLWRRHLLPAAAEGRPVSPGLDRAAKLIAVPARVAALALFVLVIAAAIAGTDSISGNLAPITVFVTFWVGMQVVSALFGDVWRAISPFETLATAWDWAARRLGDPGLPASEGRTFSHWPASVAIFVFLWFELAFHEGASPRALGWGMLVYSVAIVAGTIRWGRGWLRASDAFAVLFGLLALMSPLYRDDEGTLRVRAPFSGLSTMEPRLDTVAFVLVVLGGTTFDGFSGSEAWESLIGERSGWESTLVNTIGLLWVIAAMSLLYYAGTRAVAASTSQTPREAAAAFGHSLIPIVLGYAVAHYFSLFVLDGQAFYMRLSDPFGNGADLFGTADWRVNFLLVGAVTIAWVQLAAIVVGHVAGVMVAHDRAVERYSLVQAVRSQYPMLAVMVIYSVFGLWLLMSA